MTGYSRLLLTLVGIVSTLSGVVLLSSSTKAQTFVPPGVPTPAPGTSIKVGVPDTSLNISGCASPNAFVELFRNNVPVGTTTADSQGRFFKHLTVTNSDAGLQSLKLYYHDVNNRTSSIVSRSVNLAPQSQTDIDILMPTTIEHEPEPVRAGGYLIFRGSTCPGALVNVSLDNNLTLAALADSKGNWYVIANTDNYYKGGHVYDAVSHLHGRSSQVTQKYQFNVVGPGQAPGEPPAELTTPVIVEPKDLFLSSSRYVTVRGTGPLNAQIELFLDGSLIGSVFTNPNGEWSFVIELDKPLSSISARSCYQSRCGEFSDGVRVRYGGDITACKLEFRLRDYRFWGLAANQGLDLALSQLSGSQTYDLLVDWGDATVEHLTFPDGHLPRFHHVYNNYGQYNGSVAVGDGDGECQSIAYFSVLVTPGNPPNWWLLGVIPLAGATVYLLASFVGAYQKPPHALNPDSPPRPGTVRPKRWPGVLPWPKPALGAPDKPRDIDQPEP